MSFDSSARTRRNLILSLGALILSSSGSVRAQGAAEGTYWRPKPERFPEGLLWRLTRGGRPPSYVFGTIYLAHPQLAEMPRPVLDALKEARRFAQQGDLYALADTRSFDLAVLRDGRTLPALIGAPDYGRLAPLLRERGVGESNLERIKPWAAWLALVRPAREPLPLQNRLASSAASLGHRTVPVDLPADQAALLDSVPLEAQAALLIHAIDHREGYRPLAGELIDAWSSRSLVRVTEAHDQFPRRFPAVAAEYRAMMRSLVDNRTVQMRHRLTVHLQQGGLFFAVAAVHLPGDRGLLASYVRDGYAVEKIW